MHPQPHPSLKLCLSCAPIASPSPLSQVAVDPEDVWGADLLPPFDQVRDLHFKLRPLPPLPEDGERRRRLSLLGSKGSSPTSGDGEIVGEIAGEAGGAARRELGWVADHRVDSKRTPTPAYVDPNAGFRQGTFGVKVYGAHVTPSVAATTSVCFPGPRLDMAGTTSSSQSYFSS